MAPFNGFGKRQPSSAPPVLTPAEREALKQIDGGGNPAWGQSQPVQTERSEGSR